MVRFNPMSGYVVDLVAGRVRVCAGVAETPGQVAELLEAVVENARRYGRIVEKGLTHGAEIILQELVVDEETVKRLTARPRGLGAE